MALLSYRRHRFPPEIIQHAVWPYLRFTLSYRDVEELLAERGLDISYETVRRWVLKFGPAIARRSLGPNPLVRECQATAMLAARGVAQERSRREAGDGGGLQHMSRNGRLGRMAQP